MKFNNVIIFALCSLSVYDKCAGTATCPDTTWKTTANNCYKQLTGAVKSETEAKTRCAALGSGAIPVTVHSAADNTELTSIFAKAGDTSFYIGLEYKVGAPVGHWTWLDGGNADKVHFFDNNTDQSGAAPCAYINVVNKALSGWFSNDCKQQVQSVVCQLPSSSLESIVERLQKLEDMVNKGSIPMGFIYVQLPGQKAPGALWPKPIVWEEVTKTYANLFFRVEGNGTAAFNTTGVTVQTASQFTTFNITAKGLSGVSYNPQLTQTRVTSITEETVSGEIVPGDVVNSLKIYIDDQNAHPVNTAVKIWRRKA